MSMSPSAQVFSEGDDDDEDSFSPFVAPPQPQPPPAQKSPRDEMEEYFDLSPILPRSNEGTGAKRALVFDPSPPRSKRTVPSATAATERGRGDRQHFVMREVTSGVGGLEDAYLELRGGGKNTSFVVIKMPDLSPLENNQATVAFRPVGSFPPGQEIRFNVARARIGMFRGYRIELGRVQQKDDVFTAGIDNADRTAFPTNLSALGTRKMRLSFRWSVCHPRAATMSGRSARPTTEMSECVWLSFWLIHLPL